MLDEIMRLRYIYTWAVPYFVILIITGQSFNPVLFLAMTLIAISLNIHNDICDKDYRGYAKRHLWLMTIFSFAGGIVIYPHYLLVIFGIIIFSYNMWLKKIPIVSTISETSYALIPVLILGAHDPFTLFTFFLIGFGGQGGQELIDGEAMTKVRGGIYFVISAFIIGAIMLGYIVLPTNPILALLATAFVVVALYFFNLRKVFRNGSNIHPREKDTWSTIGNIGLIFVVAAYFL